MSEMVERVARAIAKADGQEREWKQYIPDARAAIEAMRDGNEIPERVWIAGIRARDAEQDQGSVMHIWEAMIAESLK
jgi:hypothetical protein